MTRQLMRFFTLVITASLLACAAGTREESPGAADLVLRNGKLYTMDAAQSQADTLAIRDGRIVYVGAEAGLGALRGSDTRVVDLDGRMVLPSFQDTHIHPVSGGVAYSGCVLYNLDTLAAVRTKIEQCVRDNPDAALVRGAGWSWDLFVGQTGPHKQLLDAIDSSRPLVFGDSDGHSLWVNSAALAAAGVDRDTEQPEGGEIGRDPATGELTGTLLEGPAIDLITTVLPPPTPREKLAALRYTQRYLHSLGITALQDAYVRLQGSDADVSIDTYDTLRAADDLQLRVVAALYWEPGGGLEQITALKAASERYSGGRFQVTAVKLWADGILESHTAMLLQPYTDKPDSRGLLMVPREEMMTVVPQLDAAGFQVHIHAIGDATVRYALDAFQAARERNGARDSRHLTAHTQLVHPDDIARFAALDVIAGFSPYWAYADEYVAQLNPSQIGPQRMGWMYPMRTLLDTGAVVAFGSDWPVTTADPLLGIETAVTRRNPEDPPTPVFLPAQRISLHQAIAAYTSAAAYANFLDADTGSLEVGKYADIVVLSDNLFEIPVADISEVVVQATLIEGVTVYGSL